MSGGVGQRSGAKAKFGSGREFVEGCLGKGVGGEKREDLGEYRGVGGAVMAEKPFALFRGEFEREAEGGFYLSIAFWRQAKNMRDQMVRLASQPPTIPGNP